MPNITNPDQVTFAHICYFMRYVVIRAQELNYKTPLIGKLRLIVNHLDNHALNNGEQDCERVLFCAYTMLLEEQRDTRRMSPIPVPCESEKDARTLAKRLNDADETLLAMFAKCSGHVPCAQTVCAVRDAYVPPSDRPMFKYIVEEAFHALSAGYQTPAKNLSPVSIEWTDDPDMRGVKPIEGTEHLRGSGNKTEHTLVDGIRDGNFSAHEERSIWIAATKDAEIELDSIIDHPSDHALFLYHFSVDGETYQVLSHCKPKLLRKLMKSAFETLERENTFEILCVTMFSLAYHQDYTAEQS